MRGVVRVGIADFAAVFLGGIVGTGLRLAIDAATPHAPGDFAWATLAVNTAGSFALGLLVARFWAHESTPRWLRAGLGAGLLGSFTTFSAVALTVVAATAEGGWMRATAYTLVTLVAGLVAAAAGLYLGRLDAPLEAEE